MLAPRLHSALEKCVAPIVQVIVNTHGSYFFTNNHAVITLQ